MDEILRIAKNIEKRTDGIYYSKSSSEISYPEEGNENCYQLEEDSFWFNHRNNIILEAVRKYGEDRVFFDIGGGNGYVSKALQDHGYNVVLIEPGIKGAKNARKRNLKNVICSTLEDTAFQKESLESAGMFDVVEHIEQDQEFLKNIHSYLIKDGLIYITVPAYNILWSNEDVDAGHYRRYTLKGVERLLKDSGYKIVYSSYFFSALLIPIFLFRSFPSMLGFNKKSSELKKHQKEHRQKDGILDSILNKVWRWELSKIKKNKKIPFGSSCLIVAKKS